MPKQRRERQHNEDNHWDDPAPFLPLIKPIRRRLEPVLYARLVMLPEDEEDEGDHCQWDNDVQSSLILFAQLSRFLLAATVEVAVAISSVGFISGRAVDRCYSGSRVPCRI